MPTHVFLSYSTDDTAVVTTIRDYLEAQKIACWMAPRDIVPGRDYAEQIISAIEGAVVLVLVLSESSNHSVYVRNEVERAVAKGKAIIPFRIHKVQPSRSLEFFISNHQWVEAWEAPLATNVVVLAEAIGKHLQPQHHESAEPAGTPILQTATHDTEPSIRHNLPHQLTPMIGRANELATLDELLADSNARLVTIMGPGGMGKTRLSIAVAERHLSDPRFAHGVYFIALAPISDAQHIISTLAGTLGVSLQSGEGGGPRQQVLEYVRTRSMLLVFDNFEHLLDGASLVAEILQVAANVVVLATSRERLRVPGEHLFQIQGLDYHGVDMGTAVQLFVQSARQIVPQLNLSDQEMAQISTLCRLVEGMPLAIELAASWIELLTPAAIVAEVQKSLDFLAADRRGGAEHHSSVHAVFDASWHRLDPAVQAVFAQLSIFRGGFTREAAEQVAGADLRRLSVLAGKSLIQHSRKQRRYTIHELLRQYAQEKLRATPQALESAHDRHCVYFTSLLADQELHLKGSRQSEAMSTIEGEIENIRAAWQWAIVQKKVDQIDRSLQSLSLFYYFKSWYEEGEAAFRQAATQLHDVGSTDNQGILYGKLLAAQAEAQISVSRELDRKISPATTKELLQESLSVLCALGTRSVIASALTQLGLLARAEGDDDRAQNLWEDAQAIFQESGMRWELARLLERMGIAASQRGEYERAEQYYLRGIAIYQDLGSQWGLGMIQNVLGEAYRAQGQFAKAKEAAQAALDARQAVNDKRGVAFSLYLLGDLAWQTGELDAAKEYSLQSVRWFQELGLRWGGDFALNNLGNIAYTEGDLSSAKRYFTAILAPRFEAGTLNSDRVADALTGWAAVLMKEGSRPLAVELLTLVICSPHAWQETRVRATDMLVELSAQGPDQEPVSPRSLEVVVAELLNR